MFIPTQTLPHYEIEPIFTLRTSSKTEYIYIYNFSYDLNRQYIHIAVSHAACDDCKESVHFIIFSI